MNTRLGFDANSKRAQLQLIGFTLAGDHQILVDANDTIAGYLAAKLKEGAAIKLVIENPGGNEQIRVDVDETVIATQTFASNAASTAQTNAENFATTAANNAQNSAELFATAGDTATLTAAEAYTDAHSLPPATLGATLLYNGTSFVPITFEAATLNTDANLAPKVADGQTFFVDASALASNRTIMPDPTGATEPQALTFIVTHPTSGTGKSYSLVCQITIPLTDKLIIQCIYKSSVNAYQIVSMQKYSGSL